jgi:hypothetical protein
MVKSSDPTLFEKYPAKYSVWKIESLTNTTEICHSNSSENQSHLPLQPQLTLRNTLIRERFPTPILQINRTRLQNEQCDLTRRYIAGSSALHWGHPTHHCEDYPLELHEYLEEEGGWPVMTCMVKYLSRRGKAE